MHTFLILLMKAYLGKKKKYNLPKLQKYTYAYTLLQFPGEMYTSGSKRPTNFIQFHKNYDNKGRLSNNSDLLSNSSLHNMTSKEFYLCAGFVN